MIANTKTPNIVYESASFIPGIFIHLHLSSRRSLALLATWLGKGSRMLFGASFQITSASRLP